MSFPSTPLTVLVEVALGADLTADPATWVFTDVTNVTYTRDPIKIDRGRPDWTSTADTSALTMTANNRNGNWSTRNPAGAWYGQLHIGTPIRISAGGHVRYTGFLSSLPPRWDVSGLDRYAPVQAKGLLYRLGRKTAQKPSALLRFYRGTTALGYWSIEDGVDATEIRSNLDGGLPLTLAVPADVNLGTVGTSPGSLPFVEVVAVTGDVAYTDKIDPIDLVALGVGATKISVALTFSGLMAAVPLVTMWNVFRCDSAAFNGPNILIYADVVGGVRTSLAAIDASDGQGGGATTYPSTAIDPFDGAAHSIAVTWEQVGSDIHTTLIADGVTYSAVSTGKTLRGTDSLHLANQAAGGLIGGAVNNVGSSVGIGHLAVWGSGTPTDPYQPTIAYDGEQAHTRIVRLCTEEGIPGTSGASESEAMGPQAIDSVLPLLRACEASDQGFIYEDMTFGLTYQSSTERENLAVGLALDYTTTGHVPPPLEPTDDDQFARNDVEVKRDGGSSSHVTEEDPDVELSTVNIGIRDESQTYSLNADSQTPDLASWRLHMGTYPGYRFPTLTLNLAAAPSLITSYCAADLAFRTTIAHPPTDIGPETIDIIVEGYSETLGQYDWDVAANCSLNGPWRTLELATDSGDTNPDLGRDDWDTCVLAGSPTTTATSTTVTTTPLISTDADDVPFDIFIGGERITVTACSGSSNPQTLTLTRSVNGVVKAHTAGDVVTLATPLILSL